MNRPKRPGIYPVMSMAMCSQELWGLRSEWARKADTYMDWQAQRIKELGQRAEAAEAKLARAVSDLDSLTAWRIDHDVVYVQDVLDVLAVLRDTPDQGERETGGEDE